jgi:hypothetical protein
MRASNTYPPVPETERKLEPARKQPRDCIVPLSYLRAFITVLVVAHHSLLAYHPYAPSPSSSFTAPPMLWRAFPIVDTRRWQGSDLFVGFNDIYFMALMFFISGLFVQPALARKGVARFLRDRSVRLGLPFLVAALLLAPIAYYPAYLVTGADPSLGAFWHQWKSLGSWPAGPAWFIWMLLSFDCVAALLSRLSPGWAEALGRLAFGIGQYPIRFFAILVFLSAAAYVPMALAFDPSSWVSLGPFYFQTSRVLHYAVYFFGGIAVGACGLQDGLLAPDGRLARRWALWLSASFAAFGFCIVMLLTTLAALAKGHSAPGLKITGDLSFVVCCASAGLAFLGLFLRFARRSFAVFDNLSRNAYGIYLTHYAFVIWLQYALLKAPFSGPAKGCTVFVGALGLSWAATACLRRVPAIGHVI